MPHGHPDDYCLMVGEELSPVVEMIRIHNTILESVIAKVGISDLGVCTHQAHQSRSSR